MSLINIFIIAIALSMDTFSLSLTLSLLIDKVKNLYFFALFVGIFHFILPLIGSHIGKIILKYIPITPNKLLGIIFLFLFFKLLKDLMFDKDNEIKISVFNLLILAILVSIDSFITGIGLIHIQLIYSIIFSITSTLFTLLGLKIGSSAKNDLGNKANIIGLILLLILSFIHLYH